LPGLESAPGQQFGFFAMPPGDNGGVHSAPGSLGMGWHVSTRTEVLPAAVAFVAMLHSPEFTQTLVDLARVPVAPGDTRAPSPLSADAIAASATIVEEGGNTYSYDWATPTMMDAMGGAVQGLLAGIVAPADFGRIVQQDWADFHARR
jgi:raffinose/stachyose/melibiose transport system substrate-binding protein